MSVVYSTDALLLLYHCSHSLCRPPQSCREKMKALCCSPSSLPSSSLHPTHPTTALEAHKREEGDKRKGGRITEKEESKGREDEEEAEMRGGG